MVLFKLIEKEEITMKNMKVLSLTASVSSLILAGAVSADFQGLSYDVSSNDQGTTVQVYVEVEAGDQVNAVYGDADNILHIHSNGGSFYQNAFGGNTPPNPALIAVFPSLANDSFVTIGRLTDVDNAMLEIGINWASFEGGGEISTDNGSWFATPDDAQVYEVDGRVLIGQFTLESGELGGQINLQGKNADGSNWTVLAAPLGIPAPGAIALLGLAGLASRRRRK
jgi:MYXO-CTERM domain-containing protein